MAGEAPPQLPGFDAEGWPAPAELSRAIAVAAAPMLLQRATWIHRRVENIQFLDEARVRRRVSIDFTIPGQPDIAVRSGHVDRLFLPLAFLVKRPLRNFDLRDAAGDALPTLTKDEHDPVARRIVLGLARRAVERALGRQLDEPLPEKAANRLRQMVELPSHDGRTAFEAWRRAAEQAPQGLEAMVLADAEASALLQDLASQFALFVPLAARPGERLVVKVAFEEEIDLRPARPAGDGSRLVRRLKALPSAARRLLLLEPYEFRLDIPYAGQAQSFHLEVLAPTGLMIDEAVLRRLDPPPVETVGQAVRATERAHLHPPRLERGVQTSLRIRFALRRAGVLTAALFVSLLTTGMLGAGLLLHATGVPARADAAGAVVVVVPAIIAPFLAGAEAHRLVQRIVRGVRISLLGSAAVSFVAAATLVASFRPGVRDPFWGVLALLSGIPTILLTIAWIRAWVVERRAATADG